MTATSRIDTELKDLRRLSDHGARVAILSHQGSHRDDSARHLDYISDYLTRALDRAVSYFPDNASHAARDRAERMTDGEIVVFGNTRFHRGEEQNTPELAAKFAHLGDYVALSGFSKAHRAHASNVGVLDHRPGWATTALVSDIDFLTPWIIGADARPGSAVVLGGTKPEKTLTGLAHLMGRCDVLVPGGVVLNTLLQASGYDIGKSDLGSQAGACAAAARRALAAPGRTRLHLPKTVYIAPVASLRTEPARPVAITDGVPADHAIVDFDVEPWALQGVQQATSVLVAGPPAYTAAGHTTATSAIAEVLPTHALLLGGDTVLELPWEGATSTGGGSALQLITEGTNTVLDPLRRSHRRQTITTPGLS
ncbi:phosphoglycerate kinase [Gordonia sp. ABSL11-1]|uniref:phosphoglycerate kinase n=1 Tax=Gordonia sp. ABSL11-1 TaxID=3053924 RepID=UPI0025722D7E|nr:phosphoglycerate kinase [Gordonia sp. ABSL11-1]MDL9947221.1 phosphoglycerate kinase [Gordonia sp. ABSL11-1]